MKFFISILLVFSSSLAMACQVENYKEAIKCVKEASLLKYGEGELPHSVGATKLKAGKDAFKIITGIDSEADYVAVVQVHYDEDQMLYYEINKGKNVKPKLIKDYNLVDMPYFIPALEEIKDENKLLKILSLEIPIINSMEDFHL